VTSVASPSSTKSISVAAGVAFAVVVVVNTLILEAPRRFTA
jgi:hypothetical protein